MPFEKGKPRHPKAGRKVGSINKTTASVKEAFQAAFESLQADKKNNLVVWGAQNPTEFYKLASKLIPIEGNVQAAITLIHQLK